MNKISFPRVGDDGQLRTRKEIEKWFVGVIEREIDGRLQELELHALDSTERGFIKSIKTDLYSILLASPKELVSYRTKYAPPKGYLMKKGMRRRASSKDETLKAEILRAFNYGGYRSTVLVTLARYLNVKTCPYCNMSYTLYVEIDNPHGSRIETGTARFQYDHFFSKSKYPWLSMSLYNLIPSCSFCNQIKSVGDLSIAFNPYHSAIGDAFHFMVEDPIPLMIGDESASENIQVCLKNSLRTSTKELDEYDQQFHIKEIYGCHKDVAAEVFEKSYLYPYYSDPDNFKFLPDTFNIPFKRLWLGTYTEKEQIEKRPLTKFIQDIWCQAMGEKEEIRIKELKSDL